MWHQPRLSLRQFQVSLCQTLTDFFPRVPPRPHDVCSHGLHLSPECSLGVMGVRLVLHLASLEMLPPQLAVISVETLSPQLVIVSVQHRFTFLLPPHFRNVASMDVACSRTESPRKN